MQLWVEAKRRLERMAHGAGLSDMELRRRMHETTTPLIEQWERGGRDQTFREGVSKLIEQIVLKYVKNHGVRLAPKTKFVKARRVA